MQGTFAIFLFSGYQNELRVRIEVSLYSSKYGSCQQARAPQHSPLALRLLQLCGGTHNAVESTYGDTVYSNISDIKMNNYGTIHMVK